MALIKVSDLGFGYDEGLKPVFEHVDLELDTSWKLGLVGRNGRGKTTFLNLLRGRLAYTGSIASPVPFDYFPAEVPNGSQPAGQVAREIVAPFAAWEAEMARCIAAGSEADIARYGEIEEAFSQAGGYTIEELVAAEAGKLGVAQEALTRPYASLSGGEQVKLMLAALFLKRHHFLLGDEPTDHLDAEGRRVVARWLAAKQGFILVSHDRWFLDEVVDHVLSINKNDIELQTGNYSSWRHNRQLQDQHEADENRRLQKSIRHLQQAAKRTAQ